MLYRYYSSDKLNPAFPNFAIYYPVNFSLKRSKQAVFLNFLQNVQKVFLEAKFEL